MGWGAEADAQDAAPWKQLSPLPPPPPLRCGVPSPARRRWGRGGHECRLGHSSGPPSVGVPLSPSRGLAPSLSCRHCIRRTFLWGQGRRGRRGKTPRALSGSASPRTELRREERTIHKERELPAETSSLSFFQIWCL